MEYEIVIGLEVHVELATDSKIYCNCSTAFGSDVNSQCCPVCTGMPGTLPVLNEKVIEYAVKPGLALNCKIAGFSKQDRKNYFYPDLPKAYQISQYDLPLCKEGFLEIETEQGYKKIGITRIHIEEDAGKLIHDDITGSGSMIDFNRCGIPLIEIVSEPDLRSAEEAKTYMENLRNIILYVGASDCKMQEGSMRADVNLSVREKGSDKLGTRTEMKNLNSFRSVVRAIEAEAKRQIRLIEDGEIIIQETRRWDDDKGQSYSMRSKEEAHDYRYFPEPDLPPVILSEEVIENYRRSLPELPKAKYEKYVSGWNLPEYDARIITSSFELADLFEKAVKTCNNPKAVSNWIMGELLRKIKEREIEPKNVQMNPEHLGKLILLIEQGSVTGNIAKKIFDEMFDTLKDPESIIVEKGYKTLSDTAELETIIIKVLENNPKSVSDYKAGKKKSIGFLMGCVMRETKGSADPTKVNDILIKKLES